MAVSSEWLVELARDFHSRDTWARRQAEVSLEGVPTNMQIPLLLSVVLDPEEVHEDRKNAAKHLTHLLPRDFLEFIDFIAEDQQAFIKHFLRSIEVNFRNNDVYEELACCFADIVVQLMDRKEHPKDLLDLMFSDLWSYFKRDEDDFHVIGWSALARMPKAIDEETLKLLKRDLCCEEDSVAFASADCLMSYICDPDSSDECRSKVNELLPSLLVTMKRMLACPKLRLGFLELLCVCCNYRHRALWISHEDEIVDMVLAHALEKDRQEEVLPRSVLVLSALNRHYLSDKITEILLRLIRQELLKFCHDKNASSSNCDNLLSVLTSMYHGAEQVARTSKYLENLLPSSPKDDLEATAPILLAAAAGLGTDELVGRLAPLVTDGLKDKDCKIRRAYGCIFNLLVRQQRGSAAPVVDLYTTILVDFDDPSILTKEEDPVVRSLTYERYHLYFSGVELNTIGSQQLSQVLPAWLGFLEIELRLFIETGRSTPVKNILKALTEAFLVYKEGCVEARHLFPLLRAIGTMNNVSGRSKLSSEFLQRAEKPILEPTCARVLSVLGVRCFVAAICHHVHILSSTDLQWIISSLRSFQVPDHHEGFDCEEVKVATLVQKSWRELVDFCKEKKPEFVGIILPYAVASAMQNAASTLPVEEVEDVPGMRQLMQSRQMYFFHGHRRLLCVDVSGLKLKLSAIEELELYCQERQLSHGLLLEIAAVLTDLVVIDYGKGMLDMLEPLLGSFSERAARALPKVLLAAKETGDTRLVSKTWMIIESGLMKLLWDPRVASCSGCMYASLAKCSNYVPENETRDLSQRGTLIVDRALDQFYTRIHSTKEYSIMQEWRGLIHLPSGLLKLIAVVIEKVDFRDAEVLFDALALHCKKLLAFDASRSNIGFGLTILDHWLRLAPSWAKRVMPWLLNRLASHVKRLHSILEGMGPGRSVGFFVSPNEEELRMSAELITSLLRTYTAAEPFAMNSLKEAMDQLVDQDQDEAGNMDVENFALWKNALILRLVKQITHSIHPNVLSGIVKTALKFPTASDAGKDYADALADIYTANHPAILANMGIVVTIARKACESMGDSLRGATKETFRRIVERADEVSDLELPLNDDETDGSIP